MKNTVVRQFTRAIFSIMLLVSSSAKVGSAATLPSWVSNLPLWQWYAIPNTRLDSVDPVPEPPGGTHAGSKIVAWNGATLKRSGSVYLIGAAGGDRDYAGNEVNALVLNTETPAWQQLIAPTPNAQIVQNSSFYLDLHPSATHTYYSTQFIDSLNKMIVMPSPGMGDIGFPTGGAYTNDDTHIFSFNMSNNTWDSPTIFPPYTGGGGFTAQMAVKHPTTEDIYFSREGNFSTTGGWFKFTRSTLTWSLITRSIVTSYSGAAIDPLRNHIMIVGGGFGPNGDGTGTNPSVRNLDGSLVSVTFGGLGGSVLRDRGAYPGIIYDEANDKFLVFINNNPITVYRVDPITWVVDRPSIGGIAPAQRTNGIQNAVQYVPELGGIVIANDPHGNVFFMRTSSSEAPVPPSPTPTSVATPTPTPTPTPASTNIALNKPATASSIEGTNFDARFALDGSTSTRWSSSFSDPQWIQIDLGISYAINRAVLKWEVAYGSAYQIQTSLDGINWSTVYSVTNENGNVDDIALSSNPVARYIRMNGTQRGTPYGYSLWEFEIYGSPDSGTTPPPSPPPSDTTAPSQPTGLSATAISSSQINLSWNASTDNVGVTGYNVFRNGTQITTVSGTSFQNTGLSAGTAYSYTVAAYDATGNISGQSVTASATTQTITITPPPPPPSSSQITAFQLISPQTQASAPFTIGQPFRQGDIPAGQSVVANISNFQATIKSRWPDGSAQFAILSGSVPLTANVPFQINLSAGTPPTGSNLTEQDLINAGANAQITFLGFGSVELATLIGRTAVYNSTLNQYGPGKVTDWISGPEMSSWIYSSPIGNDPSLTAWYEVRLWKGNQVEILPWIENGFLRKANPQSKTGTVTVSISSTTKFSQSVTIRHHTRSPLIQGTVYTYWFGSDPAVSYRHNTDYMQATKLLPRYGAFTPSSSNLLSALVTSYTPFGRGNYRTTMGDPGYHPSIGILPQWDVLYLTSGGDPRALNGVIANGYSAGQFGIHYRDESTNKPIAFSSYPNLVVRCDTNGVTGCGASTVGDYTPMGLDGGQPQFASDHSPSMGFMAYLLSGRYYFLEETQFYATLIYLKQNNNIRLFSKGFLETASGTNIPRGVAWGLRSYLHALIATPDSDPLKTELRNAMDANITEYWNRFVGRSNNPQGFLRPYDDYSGAGDNIWFTSLWMEDFLTGVFGYILDTKAYSTANESKMSQFYAWKAQSAVKRLGPAGVSGEWDFRDAAQYTVAVAPTDSNTGWVNGTGPWYSGFGQMYLISLGASAYTALPNTLRGGNFPGAASYWGNFQPAIAYAVTNGYPGAATAYARMTGASNWSVLVADMDTAPEWSVMPLISSTPPPSGNTTAPAAPSNLSLQ